ncbi:hypothetical protein [Azotobacter armeniacus]
MKHSEIKQRPMADTISRKPALRELSCLWPSRLVYLHPVCSTPAWFTPADSLNPLAAGLEAATHNLFSDLLP